MPQERLSRIRLDPSDEEIQENLQKYCTKAIEYGAVDSRAVTAASVPVDDRVALKCRIPKCFGYGTSAHCPPNSLTPDEMRNILRHYRWAVVFKLEVAPEIIVRDKATIVERVNAYKSVFEIVNKLESAAFYDGYYLSVGFAAGSCKSTFCHDQECTVLSGMKCRLSLRARPSMEAVGIDCYRLATELGWDIYPIGSAAQAPCIPSGTLMGLVLVT
jgi:predicted metal-binding protein